jgi:peptide/nickel transport system permease protein
MAIYAVRMLRDNLVEVLDSAYVRMAELKGLPLRLVIIRHALPNALGPTLNVTALNLGYLIGGVMIVEKVFAFPGYGTLLVDSIRFLDIAVIEASVLLASVIYIVGNLLADIVTIALNPKLKIDAS